MGVRLPAKAERRAYLRERGWEQVSSHGAGFWKHPDRPGEHLSLAAAYRYARAAEITSWTKTYFGDQVVELLERSRARRVGS